VTVISEETKRQLMRHVRVNPDKVIVIPDPISETFRACPKEFNADCPQILHIGTKENKNLPRLVQALAGLRCKLQIVGKLNERQIEALQAAHIDYVSATDLTQEQMWKCYCEADLVSFVSTYEGFGLPIVEANAVGRPVVTSNVSSMPEVAGGSACLVDPHDVASIRAGIERVIGDRTYRDALIQAGFHNAERFRVADVAQQYISVYRKISHGAHACDRPAGPEPIASKSRQEVSCS
jgi:glycosyltransferase involved in cell wall biosynthesis